jgi:hypothetical protein
MGGRLAYCCSVGRFVPETVFVPELRTKADWVNRAARRGNYVRNASLAGDGLGERR